MRWPHDGRGHFVTLLRGSSSPPLVFSFGFGLGIIVSSCHSGLAEEVFEVGWEMSLDWWRGGPHIGSWTPLGGRHVGTLKS